MDGRTYSADQSDKDRRNLSGVDGFPGTGNCGKNLKDFVENQAGLWLDGGKMFGESGIGFQRINVACPRKTLEKALTQLESAVKNL